MAATAKLAAVHRNKRSVLQRSPGQDATPKMEFGWFFLVTNDYMKMWTAKTLLRLYWGAALHFTENHKCTPHGSSGKVKRS